MDVVVFPEGDQVTIGEADGDVVLADLLRERGLIPRFQVGPDVFFALDDETLRPHLLRLVQQTRDAGISADYPLVATKIEKQIKRAQELGVRLTVILNKDASGTPVVRVRGGKEELRLQVDESVDFIRKTLGTLR